jgi:hypothetical protein
MTFRPGFNTVITYNKRSSAVSDIALILSRSSHVSFQLRVQSGGRVGLYFVLSSMTFRSVPPTLFFNHTSRPFAYYASSFCRYTIIAVSSSFNSVLATRPIPFTLEVTVILVTSCLSVLFTFTQLVQKHCSDLSRPFTVKLVVKLQSVSSHFFPMSILKRLDR